MRAAFIMCAFVLCACLSLHYVLQARTETEASGRSDPLVSATLSYPCDEDDETPRARPLLRTADAGFVSFEDD